MAASVQIKWSYAQQIEKEILSNLDSKKSPPVEHIDNLLQDLRTTCQETIFLDFQYATEQGVESRLWAVHTVIKERHKKLVRAATAQDSRNIVEIRKLKKRYADFIKTSQFFYKGYIQRLASKYCGMKDLRRIAHRLSLETLSVDDLVKVSPDLERLIDASCYATLLRLGDLSRYRNEIRTKDKSWEAALGYYNLASNLCPDSGSSHNGIAVIALSDQNHLDAVYHLYRAIAIKEPDQLAKGNLEIEFKKIITLWEKKTVTHTKLDNTESLIFWFVLLHAKLYKGVEFSTHDELEETVLTGLARLLKEQRSSEIILEKFVVISIAAEYFAANRSQDHNAFNNNHKSSNFLLRFNVRMISTLLELLKPELKPSTTGEELPNSSGGSQSPNSRERITVIARRILPALRQYSTWLVSRSSVLAAASDGPLTKAMWISYALVMTKITSVFPVEDLATVGYLLEEDEMTIGFKPLRDPDISIESNLYVDENGDLKPRLTDPGVERNHPNVEMVARIRDIILCALTLFAEQKAPIILNPPEFLFVDGLQVHGSAFTTKSYTPQASLSKSDPAKEFAPVSHNDNLSSTGSVVASDPHHNMDTDMHRMVDDLLDGPSERHSASNETSYGMHSLTANEIFAPMRSNGAPQHNTPKIIPSLPGIWQSPFTPQPNELQPTSPDRPLIARQLSPLHLSTAEQQFASAAALDKVVRNASVATGSWGKKSPHTTSGLKLQPVSRMLHESLSQQYGPMTMGSSAFTDSSSIYANNTPRVENRYSGRGWNGYTHGNGNNTTTYAGASDFETTTMLQSSIWDGSQPAHGGYAQTPPGGQGG